MSLEGVLGENDLVALEKLLPDLADSPVSGQASMANPAEYVPPHQQLGRGEL
jgi:hypothetical protein